MLFIIASHAHWLTFGRPEGYSAGAFFSCSLESLLSIGVDCFALITGFFGTRFSSSKILALTFQCCFGVIPVAAVMLALGQIHIDGLGAIVTNFWPFYYWYIVAYFGLLAVLPVLNTYLEHTTRARQGAVLVTFYLFTLVFDCGMRYLWAGMSGGYTMLWLVFVYLLGRYLSQCDLTRVSTRTLALVFAGCILLKAAMVFLHINGFRYTNPTTLLASVAALLIFSRLRLRSRAINAIAASCTMVYILNMQPQLLPLFQRTVRCIDASYAPLTSFALIAAYVLAFYAVAIAYDRLRLFFWRRLQPPAQPLCNRIDRYFH